jgi:hypothetical protein
MEAPAQRRAARKDAAMASVIITHNPNCATANVWGKYKHATITGTHDWEKANPPALPDGKPAPQPCPDHSNAMSNCTQVYCRTCGAHQDYGLDS